METKRKTVQIGNSQYLLPLNHNARYISDARGTTIVEADADVCKQLMKYFQLLVDVSNAMVAK